MNSSPAVRVQSLFGGWMSARFVRLVAIAAACFLIGCTDEGSGQGRRSRKSDLKGGAVADRDAAPTAGNAVTFERVKLADKPSNTDVALTLLKPQGWKVTGGIQWSALSAHQVAVQMSIADPGGAEQVDVLPSVWFIYATRAPFPRKPLSPYSGKLWLAPMSPADLLERVTIPGFRGREQPKVTAREDLQAFAKALGRTVRQEVKATRVRIEYTHGGKEFEEDFYMVLAYQRTAVAGLGEMISWMPIYSPFAVRAEKGKLNAASPRLLSVAFSINYTPSFMKTIQLSQARFTGVLANIQAIDRMDAARIAENRLDIAKIHQDMWNDRDASIDRRNQARRDLLGGVAPYSDGSGTTYVLPHTHKFQWAGPNGTVILTDDPNYDPNRRSRNTWSRLQPTQR